MDHEQEIRTLTPDQQEAVWHAMLQNLPVMGPRPGAAERIIQQAAAHPRRQLPLVQQWRLLKSWVALPPLRFALMGSVVAAMMVIGLIGRMEQPSADRAIDLAAGQKQANEGEAFMLPATLDEVDMYAPDDLLDSFWDI